MDRGSVRPALYPRDPSLDPQLVWRGKEEQDTADLSVPIVPIYVQERIHPAAIINSLPRRKQTSVPPIDLFGDASIAQSDLDRQVEHYQHDSGWSNRMILGDSLLVMTSLAEKEGLSGRVQTIYFDPPYGIKFASNWQVSTRKRNVVDGQPAGLTRQPEQIRAFRDTWQLGIHSYLTYLRDRLVVARELLAESGSIFVQIGDENVHLVRCLLDEVFGAENFNVMIPFRKKAMTLGGRFLENMSDYLVWYFKDATCAKYRQLFVPDDGTETRWDQVELADGSTRPTTKAEKQSRATLPPGARLFNPFPLNSPTFSTEYVFPIDWQGRTYLPLKNQSWISRKERLLPLLKLGRVFPYGGSLAYKQYLDDFPYRKLTTIWNDTRLTGKTYVVQTATKIVERCVLMTSDPGDLVLDPTCGSGTTAYVAERWGRRWITCDTSRVALALARTRQMTAKYLCYRLVREGEGGSIEFSYKQVPRVTLRSIADNPDIRDGMTSAEVDAAIARHAATETLFDQPLEDTKRVRMSGPFQVERLSPYRSIRGLEPASRPDFTSIILDNLRRSGVQNTKKGERLKFDTLDPFPGAWIHAAGSYFESDGTSRRVAVSIGPEHGTVGTELLHEVVAEAKNGGGFDPLVVCGFAFEPDVYEQATSYQDLTVLLARMSPDLSMGDELLKKTGAGNLFAVFGEPDIELQRQPDRRFVVEIKGLDVFDPTTGQIRSSSIDDIACWFLDTEYDGETFVVRHAYFTGADEPYTQLRRSLRAEIDEAAWSSLYSAVSRPFDSPQTGQIAIKVINHYGDEVVKAFDI